MATVGDAVVEFLGDRSKLNRDLDKSEKDTKAWGKRVGGGVKSALTNALSTAGGFLMANVVQKGFSAVTGFMKGAIDAGGDATETLGKFDVTFGGMAKSASDNLEAFAASSGRSKYALKGMAADFGAVLKGMGLNEDATADFSTSLAQLAVDVGSFNNAQAPEVMQKFRAAMTGEYESLKSLGIVLNAAKVDQELFNLGVEGGAKAATEMQLVQARYNLIMAATTDAQGDAARTANSWANQQVALKSIWADFMTDIGMGSTQALGPMLQQVVKLGTSALPKLAKTITEKVLPGIGRFVTGGINLGGVIADLVRTGKTDKPLAEMFGPGTVRAIETIQGAIKGFQTGGLLGGVQSVLSQFFPLEDVARVMEVLGTLETLFRTNLPLAVDMVKNAFAGWKDVIANLLEGDLEGAFQGLLTMAQGNLSQLGAIFWNTFAILFPNAVVPVQTAFDNVKLWITGAITTVTGVIQSIGTIAQSVFGGMFGEALTNLQSAGAELGPLWDQLKATWESLAPVLGGLAAIIIGVVLGAIRGLVEGVTNAAGSFLSLIASVAQVVEGISQILTGLWDIIVGLFTGNQEKIQAGWETFKGGLATTLAGVAGVITDTIKTALDLVLGFAGGFVKGFLGFFSGMVGELKIAGAETIQGFIEGIKSKATAAIDAAKSVVTDAVNGVKDFLGIHSPSTLLEWIGEMTGAGFGKGLDKSQASVLEKVGDWVNAIVGAFEMLNQMGGQGAGTFDEGAVQGRVDAISRLLLYLVDQFQNLQNLFGYNKIKELQNTAKRFTVILGAVLIDLSKIKELTIPDIGAWFVVLADVFARAMSMLGQINAQYGARLLGAVAESTGAVTQILQILGVDLNVTAPPVNFQTVLVSFLAGLAAGAPLIIDALTQVNAVYGDVLEKSATTADHLTSIFGVLGLGDQLGALTTETKLAKGGKKVPLVTALKALVADLAAGADVLIPAMLELDTKYGTVLEAVVKVTDKIKAAFGGIADAAKSAAEISKTSFKTSDFSKGLNKFMAANQMAVNAFQQPGALGVATAGAAPTEMQLHLTLDIPGLGQAAGTVTATTKQGEVTAAHLTLQATAKSV